MTRARHRLRAMAGRAAQAAGNPALLDAGQLATREAVRARCSRGAKTSRSRRSTAARTVLRVDGSMPAVTTTASRLRDRAAAGRAAARAAAAAALAAAAAVILAAA